MQAGKSGYAVVLGSWLVAVLASQSVLAGQGFTNAVGMEFVPIPAGSFKMGCAMLSSEKCDSDEKPQHSVRVEAFYLQTTEVTQEQWQAVMGNNPSYFKGAGQPVEQVSWKDAKAFVQRLNQMEGCSNCYRLPSEAQWEYAYRAGSETKWPHGNDESELKSFGYYGAKATQPVAMLLPNAWGLYDMGGNVWEWVEDCYHNSYQGAPAYATAWNTECGDKESRVLRGGSWYYHPDPLRAAYRVYASPEYRSSDLGFRVVRVSAPRTQ